jgi:electron transport complex protein RnfG
MGTKGAEAVRRRPLRAALLLAAAAVVTVGVVAIVNDLARPRIEANERARRVARLAEVLAGTRYDNDLLQDVVMVRDVERLGTDEPLPVYRARQAGQPVAAILTTVAPDGYAGSIRLLVGIAADGIDGFKGRSLGDPALERWQVKKDGGDFDQFTGATVTPRAVVRAVKNALLCFEANRATLLAAPGS